MVSLFHHVNPPPGIETERVDIEGKEFTIHPKKVSLFFSPPEPIRFEVRSFINSIFDRCVTRKKRL